MSAAGSEAGESRGYTSDSELYESQSKHHHSRSSEEEGGGGGGMTEIKPIPSHGSWLLVSYYSITSITLLMLRLLSSIAQGGKDF